MPAVRVRAAPRRSADKVAVRNDHPPVVSDRSFGIRVEAIGPGPYAYVSAAAGLEVAQVVDRTVGVPGVLRKDHFS